MTEREKEQIRSMRWRDAAYKEISESLGVSEATIKTFCRRNQLTDTDLLALKSARQDFAIPALCIQCGKPLDQGMKQKPKRFCSDKCRLSWWNTHRDDVKQKNVQKLVCAACGKGFSSYNAGRKFCSHACYIKARFGGDRHDNRTAGT